MTEQNYNDLLEFIDKSTLYGYNPRDIIEDFFDNIKCMSEEYKELDVIWSDFEKKFNLENFERWCIQDFEKKFNSYVKKLAGMLKKYKEILLPLERAEKIKKIDKEKCCEI